MDGTMLVGNALQNEISLDCMGLTPGLAFHEDGAYQTINFSGTEYLPAEDQTDNYNSNVSSKIWVHWIVQQIKTEFQMKYVACRYACQPKYDSVNPPRHIQQELNVKH